MYTRYANAVRMLPREPRRLTFVLVEADPGVSPETLATAIHRQTGLRARSARAFKADTVRWYLVNSEDVGDMTAMLILAMTVGFGVTGVMLFMFTWENLKQYAVLHALGAARRVLLLMVTAQAGLCALLGVGLGIAICAGAGELVAWTGYPFRMMWFAPLLGATGVLAVSLMAAVVSIRPLMKLEPAMAFAGR